MTLGSKFTILVDARNVLRSRWPNVAEERLVERCCAWAEEHGHRAIVVFDGRAPERTGGNDCEVVGTGAETADDWIVRAATDLHARGARYALVTSDRALRAAAGRHAERVIGGGTFLRELAP